MFATTRTMFQLTIVLVALAANACAARDVRPVASAIAAGATVKVSCVGGVVRSAGDAELYSACDHVTGDLRVSAPDLTDLSALAQLRSVAGKLEISGNSQLDDLSGLEQLEQVGALSIHDNADLDDLSGLQNLRAASSVVISNNGELGTLRGLEGLTRVERLVIDHNGLYQTRGLSNLTEVGDLVVEANVKLNSLRGLPSLSHARSVQIRNNPRLCALGMLPALARVDRDVTVIENRGLSRPDVRQLLGRVEHNLVRPSTDNAARLEASLR
jgi:Receptor L domain